MSAARSGGRLLPLLFIVVSCLGIALAGAGQTPAVPPAGQPSEPATAGRGGRGGRGQGPDMNTVPDFTVRAAVKAKLPDEQLKDFILPAGYRLELVLSDPVIQEPTAIAFDGNGRMFVVEDRSYMMDADMTGQLDPISRVSLHVDTNSDGVYDKHTAFVDQMVFPRFVVPFGPHTILTKESNAQEVWKYTDTNRDGVADRKELFDTGYGRLANIEGQEAFLTWTLDNWMYSTYNAFRARWTPHGVIKEPTAPNGGEWGVTQDDDGKIWFDSGAPGVPVAFQFPIVYGFNVPGNFAIPDQYEPDFRIPWGAPVRVADMQGGLGATRMPDGSLKSVTGSAGNDIYRGHRLPPDLVGEYLYGEPVARIVRRIHPEKADGLTILHNAYPNNEFIKSLDPLFRPVDVTTAPDGTAYITDMYHGIIQVGNFARPGTYLRQRIEQYALDKIIHFGRIWRLVYDGVKPDRSDAIRRDLRVPRMNDETPAQLVAHLGHPNGWWRDTAQQLLVLKQDKSVVPSLRTMVRNPPPLRPTDRSGGSASAAGASGRGGNLLPRFHALWTLEGLGALDSVLVRQLMEDREPRMRIQAIRASETLYKAGDRSLGADYERMTEDPDVDVAIQAMLTMNRWNVPNAATAIKATMDRNPLRGVQVVANAILNPPATAGGRGGGRGGGAADPEHTARLDRGAQIYNELCAACHGADALGTPKPELGTTMAPALAGSPRVAGHRDYVVKAILHGVTGPIDGRTYTDVMIPMGTNDDEWVAAVASYVRANFGNRAGGVTPADVARVRQATLSRTTTWTVGELSASLPVQLFTDGWKMSASQNSEAAGGGLTLTGWNTGEPQRAGMWFQIDMPSSERLAEIQFQSPVPGGTGAAVSASGAPVQPQAISGFGFPRAFKVEVSSDGAAWTTVGEAASHGPTTTLAFPPTPANRLRITLTADVEGGPAWSLQDLRVFGVR